MNGPNEKSFICRFCGEVALGGELPNVSVFYLWLQLQPLKKFPKLQIL